MHSVDRIIIGPSDEAYGYLDGISRKAKCLRSASLFRIRNHFTACGKESLTPNEQKVEDEVALLPKKPGRALNGYALCALMVKTHNPDHYSGIPSQTAQHIEMQAASDFKNWLKALAAWEKDPSAFTGKPKMPNYKKGDVESFSFTNQTASIKDGHIVLPKTKVTIPCRIREGASLREIRVSPYHGNYLVCLCYETEETGSLPMDAALPGRHSAAVDFGVDNIMTVTSDTGESVLFKGGAVKSANQWYNKRKSHLVSVLTKGRPTKERPSSRQLERLAMHRAEWMHDTFQKMSSRLIEWCLANEVGTLVLGVNKGWKQGAGMGHRNNQSFAGIPFYTLQMMVRYKAARAGIHVEDQEESYTSKASFIDGDPIPVYGKTAGHAAFSGERIYRGLYRSKDGILINADINGAANILRKWGADTSAAELSKLQGPAVIEQKDLNKRIPVKGIGAA